MVVQISMNLMRKSGKYVALEDQRIPVEAHLLILVTVVSDNPVYLLLTIVYTRSEIGVVHNIWYIRCLDGQNL